MQNTYSFKTYRYCDVCQHPLPEDYPENTCPVCIEHALFQEVKDFIRANEVNEYQLAKHFNIPLQKVRGWIREGRIQYKEGALNQVRTNCKVCGAQIAFGTICQKCLKTQNVSGSTLVQQNSDSGNMRHLQISRKDFL